MTTTYISLSKNYFLFPVPVIFVAPYGFNWANQYLASLNMLSVSVYQACFIIIHTFLFTGMTMFTYKKIEK